VLQRNTTQTNTGISMRSAVEDYLEDSRVTSRCSEDIIREYDLRPWVRCIPSDDPPVGVTDARITTEYLRERMGLESILRGALLSDRAFRTPVQDNKRMRAMQRSSVSVVMAAILTSTFALGCKEAPLRRGRGSLSFN